MGNYDRDVQWKMMQQRHVGSLSNPYYTAPYNAPSAERRAGLQQYCGTGNESGFYLEDRPGSMKRPRLLSGSSSSGLRPPEFTPLKTSTAESSNAASALNSSSSGATGDGNNGEPKPSINLPYLQSPEAMSQYGYLPLPSPDGYHGATTSNVASGNPEFNGEWFNPRSGAGATGSSSIASSSFPSSENVPNNLSRTSSVASPTTMFGMEPLIADYETGFYSLWNGSNGANVMGYEGDAADRQQVENNQVYMPEEELKMDYPQLTDLNQGDLDYIYGSMESGPTPTSASMREAQAERMFLASERLKRDRSAEDGKSGRSMMSPTHSSMATPGSKGGFRSLARNATIETKRPTLGHASASFQSHSTPHGASAQSAISPATSSGSTAGPRRSGTAAKRPRSRQCDFPGCSNRARSHQKCKKHGGAHQCVFEGCTKNSQSRGLCIAHGGGSRCKIEGCTRASQSKGLCKSHGGGEFCAVEGCRKKAHLKHLCRTHGGGVRCKNPKCMKWAQRKGWCMAHAKEVLGA